MYRKSRSHSFVHSFMEKNRGIEKRIRETIRYYEGTREKEGV
jgi:hypothetical protein